MEVQRQELLDKLKKALITGNTNELNKLLPQLKKSQTLSPLQLTLLEQTVKMMRMNVDKERVRRNINLLMAQL